jgi:hypothetical protein
LTLTANSTIDFDSLTDGNLLVFGSGSNLGIYALTIANWSNANFNSATLTSGQAVDDRLVFNMDMSSYLSQISFTDGGTTTQVHLGNGFYKIGVTAVPESTTIFGALALLGLVGYRERRRCSGWIAKCISTWTGMVGLSTEPAKPKLLGCSSRDQKP